MIHARSILVVSVVGACSTSPPGGGGALEVEEEEEEAHFLNPNPIKAESG